jgi:hypothetical protein
VGSAAEETELLQTAREQQLQSIIDYLKETLPLELAY